MWCLVLFYDALPCLVFCCVVLCFVVLCCDVLSRLVLSCVVLCCLMLSCVALCCLVLPCIVFSCVVLSMPDRQEYRNEYSHGIRLPYSYTSDLFISEVQHLSFESSLNIFISEVQHLSFESVFSPPFSSALLFSDSSDPIFQTGGVAAEEWSREMEVAIDILPFSSRRMKSKVRTIRVSLVPLCVYDSFYVSVSEEAIECLLLNIEYTLRMCMIRFTFPCRKKRSVNFTVQARTRAVDGTS